jgi:primosomal protein N' (replication factor Y)
VADTSLYFPDFTAEERTYQMLNQVLGRVGRGHRAGTVFIQTYQPESPTIRAAIEKDYASFYDRQILERQTYRFPPFCHVLKLSHARASQAAAHKAAETVAAMIREKAPGIELIGPSPAFVEKMNNKYHWQIVIKAKQRQTLLHIIDLIPANWSYDIDPTNLL